MTLEGALLTGIIIGVLFWVAFATIKPLREGFLRLPGEPSRLGFFVLGAAALAYGAGSLILGKTTVGAGVVFEAVEPSRFWLLVKLQLGAGCVLVLLGLVTGGRSR